MSVAKVAQSPKNPQANQDSDSSRSERELFAKQLAEGLFAAGLYDLAAKVKNCCDKFSVYAPQCSCETKPKLLAKHCGVRLCPECEHRRGVRLRRVLAAIEARMSRPKHLVLTIKNVPSMFSSELKPRKATDRKTGDVTEHPATVWDDLGKFFGRMTHRKAWKEHVRGWVWTKEVTRGNEESDSYCPDCGGEIVQRTGRRGMDVAWSTWYECAKCARPSLEPPETHEGFHPHLHCLIDSKYWDKREISELWKKVTRGRGYIVRIRQVDEDTSRELVKYFCKASEIFSDPWALAEVWKASHGRRLFGAGGTCFDCLEELEAADDLKSKGICCPDCESKMEYIGEAVRSSVYLDLQSGEWCLLPGVLGRLLIRYEQEMLRHWGRRGG